ncbi:MAG: hypothetical protein ACKVZJ_01530, partial [Phycisphaerales bacterium]
PALAEARRAAQAAVSVSNLRQLNTVVATYAGENKDSFVNPFQRGTPWPWWGVLPAQYANQTGGFATWNFNDGVRYTELFSAHWGSLVMAYIDEFDLENPIQFAPGDTTVIARFRKNLATRVAPIEELSWDGSYFYSPTMWISPDRYRTANLVAMGFAGDTLLRRNRIDNVIHPSAKVMVWERFDFQRIGRRSFPAGGGRAKLFPNWNNPEASPRFGLVDGSVDSIPISRLDQLTAATNTNTRLRDELTPSGTWAIPQATMQKFDMHQDDLEYGPPNNYTFKQYFWATRNGVQGRDIPR